MPYKRLNELMKRDAGGAYTYRTQVKFADSEDRVAHSTGRLRAERVPRRAFISRWMPRRGAA